MPARWRSARTAFKSQACRTRRQPVIKPPEGRDVTAVEPSTDRQVVTTSARAQSLQFPPPPEAEPAEDTDQPENLEIDDDPGAIIDWLIQENRKERAVD